MLWLGAAAQPNAARLHLRDVKVAAADSSLTLDMKVDAKPFKLSKNKKIIYTPFITDGRDTVRFDASVTVAGKMAWYYLKRSPKEVSGSLLRSGAEEQARISTSLPMQPWMSHTTVGLYADTLNECRCGVGAPITCVQGHTPIANIDLRERRFNPRFAFVAPPDVKEKRFNLSGRAHIQFIVNKTDINWSLANNRAELDTILKTIAVVKDNPDAEAESIALTGYASPEGPYLNNVRLSKGRTEVIKEYVRHHSSFPADIYHTAYVPEDWEGLKAWLLKSNVSHRDEMIAFIDNPDIRIETKNDEFQRRFPSEYPMLLAEVYPPLRHTDYVITYKVRKYLNLDEIREAFRTRPNNLSLNEFYKLANSYEIGSPEYNEVFDVAVRMYPADADANLNAASAAMSAGNYVDAQRFLSRAGNSALADYARGVLAALQGDYATARPLIEAAAKAGVEGADDALSQLQHLADHQQLIEYL